jgi:hypothetical protein
MLKNQISQYDLSKRPEISEGVTPFLKVSVETHQRPGGDFQERCHSLAAFQAAWINGSA